MGKGMLQKTGCVHNYGDINLRALSFASPDDLMDIMGLIPGAVTPLGLLNDSECKVTLFSDRDFMDESGLTGVHPNDNTANKKTQFMRCLYGIKETEQKFLSM